MTEDLITRLRKRAEIRRGIPRGEPDRISDILEEAADAIEHKADSMNPGYFVLSPQVLVDRLPLPAGTEVIGARWDEITRQIHVFVRHPVFPKTQEGVPLFQSRVVVTEHRHDPEPGEKVVTYLSRWHL